MFSFPAGSEIETLRRFTPPARTVGKVSDCAPPLRVVAGVVARTEVVAPPQVPVLVHAIVQALIATCRPVVPLLTKVLESAVES